MATSGVTTETGRKPATQEKLAVCGGPQACKVKFPTWPIYGREEEEALARVVRSGTWGRLSGKEVERFEQRFAEYQGAKYGIAVVNGSVSLRIALMGIGIEAGDEVIVPPYTFLATATAVVEANAVPVFADIDPETFNLDPAAVEAAITPRTKAIIPVHVGGLAADVDALMAIAKRHNLFVIEDAAHAHGAEYKGRRVGALGHAGSFSFQASKNLTSGEGGIILTNDEELAERCRSIHNCGRLKGGAWYEHVVMGGNYRLSEFQGAVLNCQFDRLDAQATARDRNGAYLAARLEKIPGLHPQPRRFTGTRHAYHLFAMRYEAAAFGVPRQAFLKALNAEGVFAVAGYIVPLYAQPLFTQKNFGPYTGYRLSRPDLDYAKMICPNCERICREEGIWLVQNELLGTQQEMDQIAGAFSKLYDKRGDLQKFARQEQGSGA